MKRSKLVLLSICLTAPLIFSACESRNKYETEVTVPASTHSRTQVVKDQIPAEGSRKIPVTQEY